MPPSHPLVRELSETVGDALRCVATYEASEYEIIYIRPDVETRYSTDEIERIYDDLVLQNVGADFVQGLFHAGPLRCSILGFERATVFHVVGEPYGGLLVSVDADTAVELPAFLERLKLAGCSPA